MTRVPGRGSRAGGSEGRPGAKTARMSVAGMAGTSRLSRYPAPGPEAKHRRPTPGARGEGRRPWNREAGQEICQGPGPLAKAIHVVHEAGRLQDREGETSCHETPAAYPDG